MQHLSPGGERARNFKKTLERSLQCPRGLYEHYPPGLATSNGFLVESSEHDEPH